MKSLKPQTALKDEERRIGILKARLKLAAEYATRREYFDAIGEHRHLYEMLLRVACLRHRYSWGDAQSPLFEAIDLSIALAELWVRGNQATVSAKDTDKPYTDTGHLWSATPAEIDFIYFRFATAAIIALLKYPTIPEVFLRLRPDFSQWNSSRPRFLLNYPDFGVLELLAGNELPGWWGGMSQDVVKTFPDSTLLTDTLESYLNIIRECRRNNWSAAIKAISRSESLYLLRYQTESDEFEPWEGVGGGNPLSLDLRLGALLNHCFPAHSETLAAVTSIHRWSSCAIV